MTLYQFIKQLEVLRLTRPDAREMEVFYRHGASGDCGPLASAFITDEVSEESGPFDLKDGEEYISIYAGN